MASPNRPARLNRTLLALFGLMLLAAGAFQLTTAFGVLPLLRPDALIIPTQLVVPVWAPWVGAVAAVIVGLLCLSWLLAQGIRRPKTGTWTLTDNPRQGTTKIAGQTASAALVAEIETYPGVHKASARLSGSHVQPVVHLVVATEDRADIRGLRERIDAQALPRLAHALDLDTLPADLLLRLDDIRSARTR
jgi:hypothetical protein